MVSLQCSEVLQKAVRRMTNLYLFQPLLREFSVALSADGRTLVVLAPVCRCRRSVGLLMLCSVDHTYAYCNFCIHIRNSVSLDWLCLLER